MLWRQNSRSPHCFGRTPTRAEPAWPEPCFVSVSDSNSQTCTADQFRQCDFAINVFNQSLLGHLYSILLWVYLILQFERFPLLPNTLNNCNFQTVDLHTKYAVHIGQPSSCSQYNVRDYFVVSAKEKHFRQDDKCCISSYYHTCQNQRAGRHHPQM